MTAIHNPDNLISIHHFDVEMDGVNYVVNISVDQKGRFVDEDVIRTGEDGCDPDAAEAIVEYISNNWDTLVKKSKK